MAIKSLFRPINLKNLSRSSSTSVKLLDLDVDKITGIASVTLQRPSVNSLNLELLSDIATTLEKLKTMKCKGAILTSAAPTTFSAGVDIMEIYKPDKERVKLFWTTLQDVYIKLYMSPYPTVAVINGHAPGGGCMLSTICEYRIMQKGYKIGLNETQVGIIAPRWFMLAMKSVIGMRQTELALTTGKLFTTDEAHKIGLVDEIVFNKAEGVKRANAFLSQFSRISPIARSMSKQNIRKDDLDDMVKNRQNDLEQFLSFVFKVETQKMLEMYLDALKKRSQVKVNTYTEDQAKY